jgi:pimeloyl-ACP methyl ester carboxylesterase
MSNRGMSMAIGLLRGMASFVLVLIWIGAASANASCDDNGLSAVSGGGLCLAIVTIGGNADHGSRPTLVVMLHGDVSQGGPADYHIGRLRDLEQRKEFVPVAVIRPGYEDGKGHRSEGTNFDRKDSYTRGNITAIGKAVQKLKQRYHPKRTVLVGHSGGAAIAGVIIGEFPGLVDKAILISCPCDIAAWREMRGRGPWKRSLSPSAFVARVPRATEIVGITGRNDGNTPPVLAEAYTSSLQKRNIKAKLVIADGAGHNLDHALWQAALAEIVR